MNKRKKAGLIALFAAITLLVGGIFAACGSKTSTLSFETNCEISIEAEKAKVGSEYTLPSIARDGWAFDGWFDNEDLTGEAVVSVTVPEKNTTYYAKWTQMYLVLLDVDGGTLSVDAAYVRPGDNILSALEGYIPEKDGVTFGGWFYDDATGRAVGENDVMPAEKISLLARYQVGYKAELYTKDLEGDGYTLEKVVDGKDYVGDDIVLPAPELEHFVFDENAEGNITERKLHLDEKDNVFRFYYDRGNGFTITYEAGAPEGHAVSGKTPSDTPLYGAPAAAADCGFSVYGYRFSGWSTQKGGEAVYHPGDPIETDAPLTLFAVWERGFTDRMGGTDVIFLPEKESGVAILSRGGVETRGTVEENVATFQAENGKEYSAVLTPAMFTFAWKNSAMEGTYKAYYGYWDPETETVGRISENETLKINADMTAVYTHADESPVEGTIEAEGNGYIFLHEGTALFTFSLSTVTDGGNAVSVFLAKGEEAADYSLLNGLYIYNIVVRLDGMGGILYDAAEEDPDQGYYHIDSIFTTNRYSGRMYTAFFPSLNSTMHFMTYENYRDEDGLFPLWVERDDEICGTFTDSDNNTLELDGYAEFANSAKYTVDGVAHEGEYDVTRSPVFGTVVTFTEHEQEGTGQKYTFRLEGKAFSVIEPLTALSEMYRLVVGPSGATTEEVFLVTYDKKEGQGQLAEIYIGLTDGSIQRATKGYIATEDLGGVSLTTFTRTEEIKADLADLLFFTSTFKYLTSRVSAGSGMDVIEVYYVLEHDDVKNYKLYTEVDAEGNALDGTIWEYNVGISHMGSIYRKDGVAIEGSFNISGVGFYENQNFASFLYYNDRTEATLYFLVENKEEGNTYRVADFPSRTLVRCPVTGPEGLDPYSSTYSLILDGVGGAIYAPGGDASVNDQSRLVRGTYRQTDETPFGDLVYTFTPEENTLGVTPFEFTMGFHADSLLGTDIVIGMYIYRVHDTEHPDFYHGENGSLLLDGYCNQATYTDADLVTHEGTYYYYDRTQTSIYFYDTALQAGFAIDLVGEDFTVKDGMQGSYPLLNDNLERYEGRIYTVRLNGYSEVVLAQNEREVGRGVYTKLEDEEYTYRLDIELTAGTHVSYLVVFMGSGNSIACVVKNVSLAGAYRAEDLTVLVLDGFGSGTVIDALGIERTGRYSLIGNGEGAFEYSDGKGGFRFSYNIEEGVFEYNSSYFTEPLIYYAPDLSSIVYNGMYAIYNGIPYFFNIEGTDVTLFTGDDAPSFHDTLPEGPTHEFKGVTYYLYTVGTPLTFKNMDEEITVDIDLTFTPDGENDYVALDVLATLGTNSESFAFSTGYDEEGNFICSLYDRTTEFMIDVKLNWNPSGVSTYQFVEVIAERTETYEDGSGSLEEGTYDGTGTLTFYYYSVGSVVLQGRIVGNLQYPNATFTFEEDISAMETIAQDQTELGTFNLSQILFHHENDLYAVRFYLGSITTDLGGLEGEYWYILDSISICKEFNTADDDGALNFLVRTYQYLYMYPDYSEGYEQYDLIDVDLYLDIAEEGEDHNYIYMVPRFYYVAKDCKSVSWGVQLTDEDLLGFVIKLEYGEDKLASSASVATCLYGQFADEDETFFVEVCYDYSIVENRFNILGITVLAKADGEKWVQVEAEFMQNEDGTWTATTSEGTYSISISLEYDEGWGQYYALLHIEFTPNA